MVIITKMSKSKWNSFIKVQRKKRKEREKRKKEKETKEDRKK